MRYLFLDLEFKGDYEFFMGEFYSEGDAQDVKKGDLAIIDMNKYKQLFIINGEKIWVPIEISKIRTLTWQKDQKNRKFEGNRKIS